jgi:hypothetical protein
MDEKLKVVDWITYDEAEGKEDLGFGGLGGWFGTHEINGETHWDAGHRWEDYKKSYKEEAWLLLEELRRSIIERQIRCTGEQHQNGYKAVPLWSNGKVDTYSYRAWGDLMAAVWSTEDDKNYNYMTFYM